MGVACDAAVPFVPFGLTVSEKKVSTRVRSSFEVTENPFIIRTLASRVDSWLGFSRRRAFCVAARAVGEGGRGAGFMAWATMRGIVGILQEETTGSDGCL